VAIWVKICGVTRVEDALLAVSLGANAVGVNLIESSKRGVDLDTARAIVAAIGARAVVVGVVADLEIEQMQRLRQAAGFGKLQLHGQEPTQVLQALLPDAYKAIRVARAADVQAADRYGGEPILVDAKVEGQLGGTGTSFDWSLVQSLARRRHLLLAGGLTPDNVADAITQVQPWGVDVASGVEDPAFPRRKDPSRLERFLEQARKAAKS
jgi:phosphoribosylanthranilate isomerase